MPDERSPRCSHRPTSPARRSRRRRIARAAAARSHRIALIHLLDLPGKFEENPYMAGMFVALIARCLATAGRAAARKRLVACAAAALPPLATIVGFTLTRTSGLPQAIDDVGDWTEALGLASPLVEGAVAALAGGVLEPATPANDSS